MSSNNDIIVWTRENADLDKIPGVGDHQPQWADIECPSCETGYCGGHPDVLACKECEEDWPCSHVQAVIDELERIGASVDTVPDPAGDAWLRAETAGRRDVVRRLRARVMELRPPQPQLPAGNARST